MEIENSIEDECSSPINNKRLKTEVKQTVRNEDDDDAPMEAQTTDETNQSSATPVCEACLHEVSSATEGNVPAADVYCKDCQQLLCKDCSRYHLKNKLLKSHQIIRLEEYNRTGKPPTVTECTPPLFCASHESKPLDIYCSTCMSMVCSTCFIENHKNHEALAVDSIGKDLQSKIQSDIDRLLDSNITRLQQINTKLKESKREFVKRQNDLTLEIKQRREELQTLIGAHTATLLSELTDKCNTTFKSMESHYELLENLLFKLDGFRLYCEHILSSESKNSIHKMIGTFNIRLAELVECCDPQKEHDFIFPKMQLKVNDISKIMQSYGGNLLGRLEDKDAFKSEDFKPDTDEKSSTKDTSDVYDSKLATSELAVKPEDLGKLEARQTSISLSGPKSSEAGFSRSVKDLLRQQTSRSLTDLCSATSVPAREPGSINYKAGPTFIVKFTSLSEYLSSSWIAVGMALLGTEFFLAIKSNSDSVEVYDYKTLQFKRKWFDKNLNNVKDMKQCKINRCLYLMNETEGQKPNEILKFDPDGVLITSWTVGSAFGQLSVSDDSNVLFTPWNSDKLEEYSSEGQLMRCISLTKISSFERMWHAIKLGSGQFIVSYATNLRDPKRYVGIFDNDGKVLKSTRELKRPAYIDRDTCNNIVVVDSVVCGVVVFDPDLKELNKHFYFSKSDSLRNVPQKALIDETNGRIFVIEDEWRWTKKSEGSFVNDWRSSVNVLSLDKW